MIGSLFRFSLAVFLAILVLVTLSNLGIEPQDVGRSVRKWSVEISNHGLGKSFDKFLNTTLPQASRKLRRKALTLQTRNKPAKVIGLNEPGKRTGPIEEHYTYEERKALEKTLPNR